MVGCSYGYLLYFEFHKESLPPTLYKTMQLGAGISDIVSLSQSRGNANDLFKLAVSLTYSEKKKKQEKGVGNFYGSIKEAKKEA